MPLHAESAPRAALLTGGPAVCDGCGRQFNHGGSSSPEDCEHSVYLCQWCIAAWLQDITGWAIVDQMRGWLVAKSSKMSPYWRAANINPEDGEPEGGKPPF